MNRTSSAVRADAGLPPGKPYNPYASSLIELMPLPSGARLGAFEVIPDLGAHPTFARFYDVGEDGDTAFLVMEHLDPVHADTFDPSWSAGSRLQRISELHPPYNAGTWVLTPTSTA